MREPNDIAAGALPDERLTPPADSREEFLLAALGVAVLLGNELLGD